MGPSKGMYIEDIEDVYFQIPNFQILICKTQISNFKNSSPKFQLLKKINFPNPLNQNSIFKNSLFKIDFKCFNHMINYITPIIMESCGVNLCKK